MTLDNLIGKTLEAVTPSRVTMKRLQAAAERNIADARITEVSNETRFDAAYKAIMQLANLALHANGYRTLTSVPGHHRTMIQALNKTVGVDAKMIMIFDALRKQRNVADYSGDPVPEAAMRDCIAHAETLLSHMKNWLAKHYPGL